MKAISISGITEANQLMFLPFLFFLLLFPQLTSNPCWPPVKQVKDTLSEQVKDSQWILTTQLMMAHIEVIHLWKMPATSSLLESKLSDWVHKGLPHFLQKEIWKNSNLSQSGKSHIHRDLRLVLVFPTFLQCRIPVNCFSPCHWCIYLVLLLVLSLNTCFQVAVIRLYDWLQEDLQGPVVPAGCTSTHSTNLAVGMGPSTHTHDFTEMLPWHFFNNEQGSLPQDYCSSTDTPAPVRSVPMLGAWSRFLTASLFTLGPPEHKATIRVWLHQRHQSEVLFIWEDIKWYSFRESFANSKKRASLLKTSTNF